MHCNATLARGFDTLRTSIAHRAAQKPRVSLNQAHPYACMGWNGSQPVIVAFEPRTLPVRTVYIAKVNHDGWFADCEGTGDRGVIQGVIAHLSHGRMLAGYHHTDTGEWVLFCDVIYTEVSEATGMADEHARVYAEQEQEHDAKFRAMCAAEGLVESHTTDAQDAIAARNTSSRNRQQARDAIENLRQSRIECEAATKAYDA